MSKYQNKSEHELMLPGVGVVEAGGFIETEQLIENPNLVLVEATGPVEGEIVNKPAVAAPAPAPAVSAPVAPVQIAAPQTEVK